MTLTASISTVLDLWTDGLDDPSLAVSVFMLSLMLPEQGESILRLMADF